MWITTQLASYAGYGAIALIVALLATPLAGALARRLGIMDYPDQTLKPHARPTPYLGGLAIGVGWLTAAQLFSAASAFTRTGFGPGFRSIDGAWQLLLPIVLGGLIILALGLMDDLRNLAPRLRLAVSAVVITTVMWLSGAGMPIGPLLAAAAGLDLPDSLLHMLSLAIGIVVVLGACNSTNLIDGLDGLCAGVIGGAALAFALLSAWLAAGIGGSTSIAALVLSLCTTGAALGFLPFNFKPARIFMGDAGSMLLGYSCGMLILLTSAGGDLRFLFAGVLFFGVPILDTALAIFRRWRSRKPLFLGDRSHFYDQLVQRGFSVPQTAITCYALTAVYGALGLLATVLETGAMLGVFVGAVVATAAGVALAGFTRPENLPPPRI